MRRRQALTDDSLERSIQRGALGGVVRRGLGWAVLGHWGAFAIQMGTTVVLARLLTPEEYGLVGMALTLTIFADQFRSLGLSQAVVQRDKLTMDQVNSLFFINAGAGFTLAGMVALSAPLVAAFYGRSELVGITVVLALTYAFNGLGIQPQALMTRRMQFRSLAVRDTSAKFLSSATAIAAAFAGAGYWALVIQQVSGAFYSVVILWLAVAWRPRRPREWRSSVPLLKFGAGLSLANFINAMGRMGDSIIIGKALGAADLGIYQRAYNLEQMPFGKLKQPLNVTMMTTLSALQAEPQRYRGLYTNAIGALSMVGMPLAVLMGLLSEEIIAVALGPQWEAAVPVFRWLTVVGFVLTFMSSTGWLFQSVGRAKAYVVWMAIANTVQIGSYFVGLRWGIVGVAAAFAMSEVAITPLGIYLATRNNPVRPGDIVRALGRPTVITAAVAAVAVPVWWVSAPALPDLLTLVLVSAAAGLTWVGVIAAWPAARRQVLTLAGRRRPTVREGDETDGVAPGSALLVEPSAGARDSA